MTAASVVVDQDPTAPDELRVRLGGEIDLANAAEVEQQLLDETSNQLRTMTIDLGGLTYIDSAGLRMLFVLATRLEIAQITLILIAAPGSAVRFAMEVAGMEALVPLHPPLG